jgi:hypothetical protein
MADLAEFSSGLASICIFSRWFDTTEPAILVGSQMFFFLLQDSVFSVLFSKTERIYSTLEFISIFKDETVNIGKVRGLAQICKVH